MNEKRVDYIDLGAGILIIWVMMFHAINNAHVYGQTDARVAIPFLTFSMPWFFYKSGQFFNPARGWEGVRRDVRKFLIPFAQWTLIGYAVQLIVLLIDHDLSFQTAVVDSLYKFYIYGYIPIDVPLWFVLSLFVTKVIAQGLLTKGIHPLACMIGGLTVSYLHFLVNGNDEPVLPVYIANVAQGIAFFMMGYMWSKYETNRWLMVVCMTGYVALQVTGYPIVGLHRNVLLQGPYLMWPVSAYCGIVAFNNVCRWIGRIAPLNYAGRHAMTLLLSHGIIYMTWVHYSTLHPVVTVVCIAICYALFLIPLTRWMKN